MGRAIVDKPFLFFSGQVQKLALSTMFVLPRCITTYCSYCLGHRSGRLNLSI